jgi:hypothetical protein
MAGSRKALWCELCTLLSGEEVGRELVNARGAELNHHVRQFIGQAAEPHCRPVCRPFGHHDPRAGRRRIVGADVRR